MPDGLLVESINSYVRKSEDNKSLIIYEVKNGSVDFKTEALLLEVSAELYKIIKGGLSLLPSEYGVEVAVDKDVAFVKN